MARTIPKRLDAEGLLLLTDIVGAEPTPEEAAAWYDIMTESLRALREAGQEPSEPPQMPKKLTALKESIELLKQAAEPGGIKSRHSRVRLYQMMGNISPAPETANIWRAALEKRLEEKTAPRTPAVSSKKAPARGKGGKFGGKPAGGGKPLMKSQSPEPEVAVIRRRVVSPKLAAPVQPRRIVRPTDDD
ncbi:MAG: hypothetical protein R3B40_28035 [Polyangiales bacterium]|nr:hypothetical protein [Sandaracinaceae bacterium]